jgi:hypothetical protein
MDSVERTTLPKRGLPMIARPLRYLETAAQLRDMADQMRWAESRDHLLHLAEHFAELAEPATNGAGALATEPGSPT